MILDIGKNLRRVLIRKYEIEEGIKRYRSALESDTSQAALKLLGQLLDIERAEKRTSERAPVSRTPYEIAADVFRYLAELDGVAALGNEPAREELARLVRRIETFVARHPPKNRQPQSAVENEEITHIYVRALEDQAAEGDTRARKALSQLGTRLRCSGYGEAPSIPKDIHALTIHTGDCVRELLRRTAEGSGGARWGLGLIAETLGYTTKPPAAPPEAGS